MEGGLSENQFNWQSSKLCYSKDSPMMQHPNNNMNINAKVSSKFQTLPVDQFCDLPHCPAGQANESHGLFYCFPRQILTPTQSSCFKRKPSAGSHEDHPIGIIAPNPKVPSNLKRFIVFDQSAGQTTVNYSSLIGNPISPPIYRRPAYNVTKQDPVPKTQNEPYSGIQTQESKENHLRDSESGLHENTEELNALLYSSDEDQNTEEDEETSTGHSPGNPDWFEEVASSDGALKRRKLSNMEEIDVNIESLTDTASSAKVFQVWKCSCADNLKRGGLEKMKNDRMREMVRILQSIVPGVKDEDAGVVLDEAIRYLKFLKHRVGA